MRSIILALVVALSTAGAAWAQPAATPVTGRVISIESGIVTVETNLEVKVGDRVRIEALFPAPKPYVPRSKRRLLGLSGLAVVGTVVFFRLRRPRTI